MIDPWASSTLKAQQVATPASQEQLISGKSHICLRGATFFYSVAHWTKPEGGLYQHQVDLRREAVHI
jgi:hypothetical protein